MGGCLEVRDGQEQTLEALGGAALMNRHRQALMMSRILGDNAEYLNIQILQVIC